jgi:hypothetical protein
MRFRFFATFSFILFFPLLASAQALGGSLGSTDPFTVSVNPQYPAPYSQATLSFLSTSLDLANATMTVSVNGATTYQGSIQPVSVTLGRAGSVTSVNVVVTSAGTPYTQSLVIQPEDVSLIAEPIASVPVLYPGKPFVPLEGSTRVVAIANMADAAGKKLDPATLSYTWTVDDTQIADSSGIGKDAVIVASPLQYRERSVSVVVKSQQGNLVGGDTLSLAPEQPSVHLYANDPLLGILFDHALTDTYAISGTEASLYAAPFSFPLVNGAPTLEWFLDGSTAQTGSLITLRPAGSGQGSASLSLTASSGSSVEATADLPISFGTAQSSNFFGL